MIKNKGNFYPANYLVMTATSFLLVGSVVSLTAVVIDYWLNGISGLLTDVMLFYWIASVVVLLPIHLLSYVQVRRTDKTQVTTFSLRFAHGLLGLYLFATVSSFIALSTWLIASWLNAWLGAGDPDKHLLAGSLALVQAIGWFGYVTWHFMRSRTDKSRPKYYVLTVGVLTSVVLVLSLVFPAMAYRDKAQDFVKENDLAHITERIGVYVDQHDTLPNRLTDVNRLSDDTTRRLSNYEYASRGGTKLGVFGYTLCTTFARSNDEGRDIGFGFDSHSSGKQCFTRTAISFNKLNQGLAQNLNNDATKLQAGIQNFLVGTKQAIDQEVTGVEGFASRQVKQLEGNLEGLEGGTTELQQEMERLEDNLGGLQGNTGDLAKDFAEVEKFLHDLGCVFGGCKTP